MLDVPPHAARDADARPRDRAPATACATRTRATCTTARAAAHAAPECGALADRTRLVRARHVRAHRRRALPGVRHARARPLRRPRRHVGCPPAAGAPGGARPAAMNVRPPAVAGMFYPDDPASSPAIVDALLAGAAAAAPSAAAPEGPRRARTPATCSRARPRRPRTRRSRRAAARSRASSCSVPRTASLLDGVALPAADAFRTPLGDVRDRPGARATPWPTTRRSSSTTAPTPTNTASRCSCRSSNACSTSSSLVPLVVGRCDAGHGRRGASRRSGAAPRRSSSCRRTSRTTRTTTRRPVTTAPRPTRSSRARAGRPRPRRRLRRVPAPRAARGRARARDLEPVLLDLRISGDTAGPRDRVVGYGAFALATMGATA